MLIRAVIFDMGGVILRTEKQDGRRKWETRLGLKEHELSRIVFESTPSQLAAIGQQSEEEVWRYVQSTFKLTDEQMRELVPDFWSGDVVDSELLKFIGELRSRYKTAILSNAYPTGRWAITEKFGLRDAVDEIIISAEEGVAKPDARIYRIAAERLGVKLEETVFVDDVARNVEAARALGMHVVEFKNTAQALADVRAILNQAPLDSPRIL